MINRRVTRVVLNTAEITGFLSAANGADYVLALDTPDALYLGFQGKFASRYIQVGTAPNDVASDLSVEYWDGSTWNGVDDLVDQTSVGGVTLAQSGFISWQNKEDWKASSQAGVDLDIELYWVKLTVSVALNVATTIKSILNIYSDDTLLRMYFPELISDANYLPSGKTNFLDQHIAAKDLVVLRLKQRKIIESEAQIIEANDVSIAAVYAAAMLLLQPIATSESTKTLLEMAKEGFDSEISKVSFAVDSNESGLISDAERVQNLSVKVIRR